MKKHRCKKFKKKKKKKRKRKRKRKRKKREKATEKPSLQLISIVPTYDYLIKDIEYNEGEERKIFISSRNESPK